MKDKAVKINNCKTVSKKLRQLKTITSILSFLFFFFLIYTRKKTQRTGSQRLCNKVNEAAISEQTRHTLTRLFFYALLFYKAHPFLFYFMVSFIIQMNVSISLTLFREGPFLK